MSDTHAVANPAHNEEDGIFLAGYEGAKMAMWLFLATEILIFGGLFAAYIYWRSMDPESFARGSQLLDWKLGAVNTVVLLISSLTAALSLDSIQRGNPAKMKMFLYITLACASIFLVIKFFEYKAKYEHGLMPGTHVVAHGEHGGDHGSAEKSPSDKSPAGVYKYGKFVPLYFLMTGLHGIHVLIGMACMIGILIMQAKHNAYSDYYYVPVENTALYWHLVDLIWIFLFPLMYLVG